MATKKSTFTKAQAAEKFKEHNTSPDAGPHPNVKDQCECDACETHRGNEDAADA